MDLNEILREFCVQTPIEVYGNGHINDTYCVQKSEYILQRINTNVFKKPEELMENILNVTAHLKKKIAAYGGDPDRETLTVIKTRGGESFYRLDDNNVFRVYKFISGTKTVENDKTETDLYNAGKGFGRFQHMLDDYPVGTLHETIKDFHNTPKRVEVLKEAVAKDRAGRAGSVRAEIEFALDRADFAGRITEGMENGTIPIRVTHNDTKINNILFDEKTGEAACVIDLDTVMPGSMLYDFGDALRMGGSTAAEDETDLTLVGIDKPCFEAFARGYIGEVKDIITKAETELLAFSVKLITYECGIRFLTDYLNGDVYFKTHRPNHNLDRARNQFKLVDELGKCEDEICAVVKGMIDI